MRTPPGASARRFIRNKNMDFDPERFDAELELVAGMDEAFLEGAKISWLTRFLISFALPWGFARLAREVRAPGVAASKKAHAFFAGAGRIDVVPLRSELRGFRLIIDSVLSIYFIQDGDHFAYDGFELGCYSDEGDVTIFDA